MARVFKRGKNTKIDFNDANGRGQSKTDRPSKRIAEEVLHDVLGKIARPSHLGVIEDSKISSPSSPTLVEADRPHVKTRHPERWSGIVAKHLKPASPARCARSTERFRELRSRGASYRRGALPSIAR